MRRRRRCAQSRSLVRVVPSFPSARAAPPQTLACKPLLPRLRHWQVKTSLPAVAISKVSSGSKSNNSSCLVAGHEPVQYYDLLWKLHRHCTQTVEPSTEVSCSGCLNSPVESRKNQLGGVNAQKWTSSTNSKFGCLRQVRVTEASSCPVVVSASTPLPCQRDDEK